MSDHSRIIPLSRAKRTDVSAAPVNAEIAHFQRQNERAAERLAVAGWDEAKRALLPIFDLAMQNGTNEAGILAGLRATCATEPLWAIQQTVMAFVTGREGNGFCPNSAEFGTAVRKLTDPIREDHARSVRSLRDARQAAEFAESQPISDATRARAAAFLESSKLVADQERMSLRKPAGPDLSAYYKNAPNGEAAYKPLTPDDVKDIPNAKPKAGGLQPLQTPGFNPLPRKAP